MVWNYIIFIQLLPIGHKEKGNKIFGWLFDLQQFVNRMGPLMNSHWGYRDREEKISKWVFKEVARIIELLNIIFDDV